MVYSMLLTRLKPFMLYIMLKMPKRSIMHMVRGARITPPLITAMMAAITIPGLAGVMAVAAIHEIIEWIIRIIKSKIGMQHRKLMKTIDHCHQHNLYLATQLVVVSCLNVSPIFHTPYHQAL